MKSFYNGLFAFGLVVGAGACVVSFILLEWFGFAISASSGFLAALLGAIVGGGFTIVVQMMAKSRKNEPENLYFLSIEFGINKLEEGVTYQSYCEHISQLGFEVSGYYSKMTFMEFYGVKERDNRGNPGKAIDANSLFVLEPESVFRHLEHVELKEARISSRKAMTMAAISFGLAAAVGAIQISLSIDCGAETPNWLTQIACTN